jgi:hypothetical protein
MQALQIWLTISDVHTASTSSEGRLTEACISSIMPRTAAEEVTALVAGGPLDDGEANALTSKLEAARGQLEKGNVKPVANMLEAFIHQVEAMVKSGRLTAEQAQPLIDSANAAIELIE